MCVAWCRGASRSELQVVMGRRPCYGIWSSQARAPGMGLIDPAEPDLLMRPGHSCGHI